MTPDRVLAIVGVVLGIPGVAVLVLTADQTVAILATILAIALIAAALFIRYVLNAPPYTVREANVTLAFPQDEQTAILSKEYRIVPNFSHLRQIEHKNIAADGQIQNIQWNDAPVPPNFIAYRLGEYEIRIDLPFHPRRWHEFSGKLSYECIGSFNGQTESIVYCVDFPTKEARIVVEFPPNRPCRASEARKIQGAGEMPIHRPEVTPDGRRLELRLRRPTFGASYIIYWTW